MTIIHVSKLIALVDDDFAFITKYLWRLTDNGYAIAHIEGKRILMHRLIMKAKTGQTVDHINNIKLDNRKSNLRFISQSHNMRRSPKHLGYKFQHGRFVAQISENGITRYLGRFTTSQEAHERYLQTRKELIGE